MGFEYLGPKLLSSKGNSSVDTSVLESFPVVAIYFSAHWCPPCKMFTPNLVTIYNQINQGQKQLEIIFVSADQEEEEFLGYYSAMPWLAAVFDADQNATIADQFEIGSIPALIILNKDGTVKSKTGKQDVDKLGAAAIEEWKH